MYQPIPNNNRNSIKQKLELIFVFTIGILFFVNLMLLLTSPFYTAIGILFNIISISEGLAWTGFLFNMQILITLIGAIFVSD